MEQIGQLQTVNDMSRWDVSRYDRTDARCSSFEVVHTVTGQVACN